MRPKDVEIHYVSRPRAARDIEIERMRSGKGGGEDWGRRGGRGVFEAGFERGFRYRESVGESENCKG